MSASRGFAAVRFSAVKKKKTWNFSWLQTKNRRANDLLLNSFRSRSFKRLVFARQQTETGVKAYKHVGKYEERQRFKQLLPNSGFIHSTKNEKETKLKSLDVPNLSYLKALAL